MESNTVATVDLARLRHNARRLQALADGMPIMGVVKADAYGHGAIRVVEALQQEGICRFAVATVPEAVKLREAGVTDDLLVFAAPLPDHLPAYARHDLGVTVASTEVAEAVCARTRTGVPLRVHLKVDTGMARLGVTPEEAPDITRRLEDSGARLEGIWTHFATASGDTMFARQQMQRFRPAIETVGDRFRYVHVANTDAIVCLRERLDLNPCDNGFVRAGIGLYGMGSDEEAARAAGLQPIMRFTSRVTQIKDVPAGASVSYGRRWIAPRATRIATVSAGYADGYNRLYTNRADVGIRGARFPVVGTVCMDMFMVNLSAHPPGDTVKVGDEVVLFGTGGPSVYEAAAWAKTITYEVCCRVGPRVPRRYREIT